MDRPLPRLSGAVAALALSVATFARAAEPETATVTGWFSDDRCAPSRVKAGLVGPTNRECAQRCIAHGAAVVFIDEAAKGIRRVANPEAAKGQEGNYVRVTGTIDEELGVLRVGSVEVLSEYVAACTRPKRK